MRFLLGLLSLVATLFSLSAQPIKSSDKQEAITYAVKEANQNFFTPQSLKLDLLKNQQHFIPDLAAWIYTDWHPYDASLTYKQCVSSFESRTNDDKLPISFVLMKKDRPVAVISLKEETDKELSDMPKGALWLGSIHVTPMENDSKIYTQLLQFAQIAATKLGYPEMYVWLSDPVLADSYMQKGFVVVEKRPYHKHEITILHLSFG